jgi:hypothetical protein
LFYTLTFALEKWYYGQRYLEGKASLMEELPLFNAAVWGKTPRGFIFVREPTEHIEFKLSGGGCKPEDGIIEYEGAVTVALRAALRKLKKETGITLPAERLRLIGRQSITAHRRTPCILFGADITQEEFAERAAVPACETQLFYPHEISTPRMFRYQVDMLRKFNLLET